MSYAKGPTEDPAAQKKATRVNPVRNVSFSVNSDWYMSAFDDTWLPVARLESPEVTERETAFMVEQLRLGPGSRILDVPCGHGRHALALAARGYQVTAIDLSEHLLAHARSAASEQRLAVDWVRADMRAIPYVGEFNAVVNLGVSFGFFENEDQDQLVLNLMAQALDRKGRIMIEFLNLFRLARPENAADRPEKVGSDPTLSEQREYDFFKGPSLVMWKCVHGQSGKAESRD